jgi:hypothetical protein
LLVAVKTMEDLGVRAKALDRAKARAAIDLCQGRIVKGNKRVAMKPTEVVLPPVAMSLPAAAARLVSEPPAVQLPPAAPVTIAAPPAASARPEAPAVKLEPVMTKPKAAKPEAKPEAKPKASSGATRLATFKQQAYVRDLMRKAGVKEENIAKRMEKLLGVVKSIEELSAQEATTAIDKLRGILAKKKPVA